MNLLTGNYGAPSSNLLVRSLHVVNALGLYNHQTQFTRRVLQLRAEHKSPSSVFSSTNTPSGTLNPTTCPSPIHFPSTTHIPIEFGMFGRLLPFAGDHTNRSTIVDCRTC